MSLTDPGPIDTPRLRLRRVQSGDLAALHAVNGDPEVTRHLPYATWTEAVHATTWYARMQALMQAGTALQFVVCERDGDAEGPAIATVLLFRHEPAAQRAEIGYVLGRAHWGRGVMREALQGLVATAFGPMGLRRLEAEVNPANTASTALLRRLGFQREGLLRQRWVGRDGRPYDVEHWGLLRGEQA